MATGPRILHRDRRTLDALFQHPVSGNLSSSDVWHLFERLGAVRQEPNGKLLLTVSEHRLVFHEPHRKELTPEEVTQLRKFLETAGVTPATVDTLADDDAVDSAAPDMLVAVDHHQARVFTIDAAGGGARTLRPYDPHHFLHHLTHRQERELRGQREPEDPGYYAGIAAALAPARRIIVLGHGTGHSNAAAHLEEVLRAKHPEIGTRILATRAVDLSAATEPQLLAQALQLLDSEHRTARPG
ncbi:MAG: hypothetical protein JO184_07870 [Gammaproteobacteria bacterium]|nr:hypothetical protein [Gammaproteobacteria bacterium]